MLLISKISNKTIFSERKLEKLVEIKPFFKEVRLANSWEEDISKEYDPELSELLTDEKAKAKSKTVEVTDSEEDVDSSNNAT